MSENEALVVVIALLVCGLFLTWYFQYRQVLLRRLTDRKAWPIGKLPSGRVGKLVGTARPVGAALIAPISKRKCVYYEVSVLVRLGKSEKRVAHEEDGVPFHLEDETGRAIVDPRGAEVVLDQDFASYGNENAKRKAAFLARHGRDADPHYKYYESIIEIGETVAVLGAGTREPDPDAKPSDDATRLLVTHSDTNKLVISDVRKTTR